LLESRKKDTLKVELELKTLKDKYNSSIDLWNKEKLEMQVNLNYLEVFLFFISVFYLIILCGRKS